MVISMEETKNDNILKDNTQEIVDLIRSNLSVPEKKERLNDYHENDIADVLNILNVRNYTSYLVLIKLPRSFPTWKRTLVHIWKNLTRNVLPISLRAWTPMMP